MSIVQSPMKHMSTSRGGEVQLIIGPMFSGKTTELLRRIRRYTVARKKCMVIKYEADTRYSKEDCATHDNYTHKAVSCRKLCSIDNTDDFDVIGIDEGQFYPDLLEFCEDMADAGKKIIIAALDGTYERKPFGQVMDLVPMAERVTKLTAVCMLCQNSAAFTSRISNDTQVQVIGGQDMYISTCRQCFKMPRKVLKQASTPDFIPSQMQRTRKEGEPLAPVNDNVTNACADLQVLSQTEIVEGEEHKSNNGKPTYIRNLSDKLQARH